MKVRSHAQWIDRLRGEEADSRRGRRSAPAILLDTRACFIDARNELEREEAWPWPPLGGVTEEALDELRLTCCVPAVQPFHLPLPHHVECFNAFERPLGGVE